MALENILEQISNRFDSLERAIVGLTEETAALREMRGKAIEAVQEAGEAGKKAPAKPKAESKPKEEPKAKEEAKEEPKANISESPEDRKDPNDDQSPFEAMKAKIAEFVGMDDNEELLKERRAVIQKFFAHPKINAKKASDVPEAMIPAVINSIEKVFADHKAKSDEASAGSDAGGDDLDLTS